MFKNNRCLISEIKNGITYFGYIDKTGKTIIAPQFLNASNFYHNKAIALQVLKKELGTSNALGKNLVSYRYFEVTIDANGSVEDYLNPSGVNVVLDKEFLRNPPKITSKQISDNIYAVRGENNKWNIVICNN